MAISPLSGKYSTAGGPVDSAGCPHSSATHVPEKRRLQKVVKFFSYVVDTPVKRLLSRGKFWKEGGHAFVEGFAVEISVWKALETFRDRLGKLAAAPRKFLANRRTGRLDRRRSVNDGIIVTLSTREEKRRNQDRRQREASLEKFAL